MKTLTQPAYWQMDIIKTYLPKEKKTYLPREVLFLTKNAS